MKAILPIQLIFPLLFLSLFSFSYGLTSQENQDNSRNNLNVFTVPDLENVVSFLASGYSSATGKTTGVTIDSFNAAADEIMILHGSAISELNNTTLWKMVIGHEIVVPVMNSAHPLLKEIRAMGMTAEYFSEIVTTGKWPEVFKGSEVIPVRLVVCDNSRIHDKVSEFIGAGVNTAVNCSTSPDVISAVAKDIYAIGFCRLTDALSRDGNGFVEAISMVPLDKNLNGKIDVFENIYSSPEQLMRGVWIGKYPRKLCSNIYAVSALQPSDEETVMFLEWVLNEGQQQLALTGLSNILTRERTAGMIALKKPASGSDMQPPVAGMPFGWKLLLGIGIILLFVAVMTFGGNRRKSLVQSEDIAITPALNVQCIKAPAGLLYDKTHTWAFMEKDGMVKVGLNDFIGHITGTLSQVKIKEPGEQIRKGEKLMSVVRNGKQLDLYSPVTGVIRNRNQDIFSNPSQVNTDPYESGWIYQVEPLNWAREVRFMFMADKFREWLDDEFTRLKDFLAASANSDKVVYEHIVLQDGGELTDNVLADMGPTVWEDFQTKFINVSR